MTLINFITSLGKTKSSSSVISNGSNDQFSNSSLSWNNSSSVDSISSSFFHIPQKQYVLPQISSNGITPSVTSSFRQ